MKDVKIVFIDIDGTLRDSKGKISEDTMKSITKLKNEGIQIVLTTGRALKYTINVAKLFEGGDYLITSNGAEIYNYKSKNLIFSSPIDKESINYIKDKLFEYNLNYIANTENFRYTDKTDAEPGMRKCPFITDIGEPINQVVVQGYDPDIMNKFEQDLNTYQKLVISNRTVIPVEGKYHFFDITNKDVSKGEAIKKLCDYLHISLDKTMCIGDSNNDIDMFNVCKYKVAVANAEEKLKSMANVLTPSNDEEGVKIVLDKLYSEIIKK
jgi:hypothetical protein